MINESLLNEIELDGTEYVVIVKDGIPYKVSLPRLLSFTLGTFESAPTGFTAITVDYQQIDLSWTTAANEVLIDRSIDGTSWETVYVGSASTFSDTGLYFDTTYYYRIKARTSGKYDSDYATANATTDPAP